MLKKTMYAILGMVIILIIACLLKPKKYSVVNAVQGDVFDEPQFVRCTCYIDSGTTASGKQTRPNTMAAKREWMGCVAEVNAVNEDGSIGEFIGYYEIIDTGYGRETGVGESKILAGRTLGTIETGDTVDVWMPTMHAAEEWVNTYGDYVYVKIILITIICIML